MIGFLLLLVASGLGYVVVKKQSSAIPQTQVTTGPATAFGKTDLYPTSQHVRSVSQMINSGQFQQGGPSIFNPDVQREKKTGASTGGTPSTPPTAPQPGGGGGGFSGGRGGVGSRAPNLN